MQMQRDEVSARNCVSFFDTNTSTTEAAICIFSRLLFRREIRRVLRREIRRARASGNQTQKSNFAREITRGNVFFCREMTRRLASGNGTQPSFLKQTLELPCKAFALGNCTQPSLKIFRVGKWHAAKFKNHSRREMARSQV